MFAIFAELKFLANPTKSLGRQNYMQAAIPQRIKLIPVRSNWRRDFK